MNPDSVDSILRQYLLGRIAPEARDHVERRLFSDDRIFWEHLSLVEDELIDDYVNDELGGEDVANFTNCFLSTNERTRKVAFARELKAYVERQASATTPIRNLVWRRISVPAWGIAIAGLLMLVRPGVTWQFAGGGRAQDDVSVSLTAGLLRGTGELTRVNIPAGSKLVRLRFEPDAGRYQTFRATLYLASGDEVSSQTGLSLVPVDGRSVVTLLLPADLLASGDYYIRLHAVAAGQDPVVVGRYDFRVLKE